MVGRWGVHSPITPTITHFRRSTPFPVKNTLPSYQIWGTPGDGIPGVSPSRTRDCVRGSAYESAVRMFRQPVAQSVQRQLMQGVGPVEHPNVLSLNRREAAHGPAQVHEVGLRRFTQGEHATLSWEAVPLSRVAGRAGSDDIPPLVGAATRQRHQVVTSQTLTELEMVLATATVLAPVSVTGKQERICDLPSELARHMHESDEPDDCRLWDGQSGAADYLLPVTLHDLRLAVQYQPEGTTDGYERQWLKGSIECKATHDNPRFWLHKNPSFR